jgi:hypothetical protein
VVLIAVIAFFLGAAAIYFLLNERSRRLRERFGPEYSRTLQETGDRWTAESTLTRRAKRVEKLHIRQLALPERTRFANSWRDVQSRFVDDPQGTLAEADRLIASLMTAEGYPVSDFEQRVADISVDHPEVVENYRGGTGSRSGTLRETPPRKTHGRRWYISGLCSKICWVARNTRRREGQCDGLRQN